MQAMLPLRESRKIVLILTDGEPDEVTPCLAAIRQTECMGMKGEYMIPLSWLGVAIAARVRGH